jgi:hypothetical protein
VQFEKYNSEPEMLWLHITHHITSYPIVIGEGDFGQRFFGLQILWLVRSHAYRDCDTCLLCIVCKYVHRGDRQSESFVSQTK